MKKKKEERLMMAFCLTREMLDQLRAQAKIEDRNVSETVRHIIKAALAGRKL